jgi:hypothetical protein
VTHPPPESPGLPPAQRTTVLRDAVFVPKTRQERLRAAVRQWWAEVVAMPGWQVVACLSLGGNAGLVALLLMAGWWAVMT